METQVDRWGYRINVGIVLANPQGQVFWAKRQGFENAWQFPQGGVLVGEKHQDAVYRELYEEVGLLPEDVINLGCTRRWISYRLPTTGRTKNSRDAIIGQRQKWYGFILNTADERINLNAVLPPGSDAKPEFDAWDWVSYWYPLTTVVFFKRQAYRMALTDLSLAFSHHFRASYYRSNFK